MAGGKGSKQKPEIVIEYLKLQYTVEGFEGEYGSYYKAVCGGASFRLVIGWPLRFLGWLLLVIGIFTMLLDPGYVRVDPLDGPTILQFIQMRPDLITMLGVLIFGTGILVESINQKEPIPPEEFLRLHYSFLGLEYPESEGDILIKYIRGDDFYIVERTRFSDIDSAH